MHTTRVTLRPRFEGSNIRTWIGFKQLMFLAEEAVLEFFRAQGCGPQRMFHEHGLCFRITDSSFSFSRLVEADDLVTAEITPVGARQLALKCTIRKEDASAVAFKGHVEAAFVAKDPDVARHVPAAVAPFVVSSDQSVGDALSCTASLSQAVCWSWAARYFHCQHSQYVQHSAYVRALEEMADRFLEQRDLRIGEVLQERQWIPVVSRARVRVIADAFMEEEIHSSFAIDEMLKNVAFSGRMDCHVERPGAAVRTAYATIVHGYAASDGPESGRMVEMDAGTVAALLGCRV